MTEPRLIGGVTSQVIDTPRLKTHLLVGGLQKGAPVLFIHGNVASSRFFEETLATLPLPHLSLYRQYHGLAPDLRGFGESETKPVDATGGLKDFSDDLHALTTTLGYGSERKVHLVGWSMGGGIAMQYTIDHPEEVASLTLINPLPPYGIGGTKDTDGMPCYPDFAGGGGRIDPEFVYRLARGDRTAERLNSPRNVMNRFYFKSPFRASPEQEEAFLSAMLSTKVDGENYPGDRSISQNWPYIAPGSAPSTAPGVWGIVNAISPKYCNLAQDFAKLGSRPTKPKVLWIRGEDDLIVSDKSPIDFAELGRLKIMPYWPGEKDYPPQPMVSQTRAVLKSYQDQGGSYQEECISDCGHSPHIEKPREFRQKLFDFLDAN